MSAPILIVDDDDAAREVLAEGLLQGGYEVHDADCAEAALAKLTKVGPAVVITDLRMPGMSGLELLARIRESTEGIDVIVVTGHEDMTTAVTAMKEGAFDYMVKPLVLKDVNERVGRCLREQELERLAKEAADASDEPEPDEHAPGTSPIIGRNPRMIEIYKLIGVLSRNRATVLVRGETGTGKELIARGVHANSIHHEQPFIAVNCTALSDTLLESELFGHVKGAFTGATGNRKGYFELAGSGTIFLDEIGDTSAEFQTRLLRVLQERRFYPVGGEKPKKTEARVIAATHQPIERLVEDGTFREDLYFRLRVVEVRVPPLRERPDDIPLIASALLDRIRDETHQSVRHISPGAMEKLTTYEWPGNVRELENALTRAAILARGSTLAEEHLALGEGSAVGDGSASTSTVRPLREVIAEHVRRAAERSGGDLDEAADLLEISREELDGYLEGETA